MIKKLYLLWRILATGYSFVFLGFFGLLLTVTVFPILCLAIKDPVQRHQYSRQCVRSIWRFYVWQMTALGLIRVRVEGQQYLDEAGGKLVIANHPSLLDVILLITVMPVSSCCVVKEAMWSNSFFRGVVRAMGYINNSSAEDLLGGASRELAADSAVLLFPEGTRTEDLSSVMKFQRGAANIATRCGEGVNADASVNMVSDIVPVFVYCDPPTLRKNEPWYRVADRRVQFLLVAQPPIQVADVIDPKASSAKNARVLTRFLEQIFSEGLQKGRK